MGILSIKLRIKELKSTELANAQKITLIMGNLSLGSIILGYKGVNFGIVISSDQSSNVTFTFIPMVTS